ncbi:hypothetical protein K1719_012240 [Acacia pycnantha]|nr:hypothetical protein K1719_012240 [Acacia pycnantha]
MTSATTNSTIAAKVTLLTNLASSVSHVAYNFVRPLGGRPNLQHVQSTDKSSIPLIDLQDLDGPNRSLTIRKIGDTSQKYGFFQIHIVQGKKIRMTRYKTAKWLREMDHVALASLPKEPFEEELCLALCNGLIICNVLNKGPSMSKVVDFILCLKGYYKWKLASGIGEWRYGGTVRITSFPKGSSSSITVGEGTDESLDKSESSQYEQLLEFLHLSSEVSIEETRTFNVLEFLFDNFGLRLLQAYLRETDVIEDLPMNSMEAVNSYWFNLQQEEKGFLPFLM